MENVPIKTAINTDRAKEISEKYVHVVGMCADNVLNVILAVFSDLEEAKEFVSYLNKNLLGEGASHPEAVYIATRPFNPKKDT